MKELYYRALVIKFIEKDISDDEIEVLKAWLKENPINRRIFDEENELWQEAGTNLNFSYFNKDKAWSDISDHLGISHKRTNPLVFFRKKRFFLTLAAASVALLIIFGGLTVWLTYRQSNKPNTSTIASIKTNEGEKVHIFLSDSTSIFMNSGSNLVYGSDYNIKDRIVKLSGEAFFDVHTNPEKPFIVQLDEMSIIATGTRFNVSSYGDESRIEATLEEGEIHIPVPGHETYNLQSGQQLVYFRKTKKSVIRDVPVETYTSWRENKLRFIDTPFEEVLRKLARRYNVIFEIRNLDLLKLKYTATFIDESIVEVMDMLKVVSPISYSMINRTSINDTTYLKPKIIVRKRKLP